MDSDLLGFKPDDYLSIKAANLLRTMSGSVTNIQIVELLTEFKGFQEFPSFFETSALIIFPSARPAVLAMAAFITLPKSLEP